MSKVLATTMVNMALTEVFQKECGNPRKTKTMWRVKNQRLNRYLTFMGTSHWTSELKASNALELAIGWWMADTCPNVNARPIDYDTVIGAMVARCEISFEEVPI